MRRGRSLQATPGETFPGTGPRFSHTVLKIQHARGPAPGNFFWGRMKFLGGAGGRVSEIIRREFSGVGKRLRLRCNPPENGFSVDKNFYFCRHLRPIRRSLSEKPVPRAPPARPSPARAPRFSLTVLQIQYARGPAPGNFFWGRMNFWGERTGAFPEPSAVDFQGSADGRVSGTVRRGFSGISRRARSRNRPPWIFRDQQTGAFPKPSAVDFQRSGEPLVKSLPCVKGGGTR